MKKIFLFLIALFFVSVSFAQEEEEEKDKKTDLTFKEKLFTGGGITLSFSGSVMVLGATPVFGCSVAKWLDVGVLFNYTYGVDRHITYVYDNGTSTPYDDVYYSSNDKFKQTLYGPGVFVRAYPVNFLFVQGQAEYNFIRQKFIYENNAPTDKAKVSVFSTLVGGGYCNGRYEPGEIFYYLSIMFDVAGDINSPYVERSGNNVNIIPIIRGGIQIPLFQGKRSRRD